MQFMFCIWQEQSSEKFHVLLDKVTSPDTSTCVREASRIDFVHEKRHMDATGQGNWRFWRFSVKNFEIIHTKYTTVHKI